MCFKKIEPSEIKVKNSEFRIKIILNGKNHSAKSSILMLRLFQTCATIFLSSFFAGISQKWLVGANKSS